MIALTTNEEIALKLGWQQIVIGNAPQRWVSPTGDRSPGGVVPDFEHDWAHTGPLWAELVKNWGLVPTTTRIWYRTMGDDGDCPSEDELKAATCRAWLAWKKEEEE